MKPDEGEIFIDGQQVNDIPPEDRGIGMLFEHMTYALFPHYSIYENIIYGPRVKGETDENTKVEAREMLQLVLLEDRADDLPHVMSGGMKQRVALARALMTGSKLILLDEPASGMNLPEAESAMALIRSIQQTGTTVVIVEHNMKVIMQLCSRIAVLNQGVKIAEGTPQEISRNEEVIAVYLGKKREKNAQS